MAKDEVKTEGLTVEQEVIELQRQTLRKQAIRIASAIMTEKGKRRKWIKEREKQVNELNELMMQLIEAEKEADGDLMAEIDSKVQAFGK